MIDLSFWKPTIILALPFGITGIFTMIYFWIDSVILSIMVGNEVVGWYNAAYRLIFIFISLYSVYMVSIFPIMSRFYKTSKKSIKLVYERSFKFLLIISLPLAVFTTLMADKIILIIYGTGYIPSIIALQILIWSIVFMFVNNLSLNLLGSVNRPLVVAKIIASGAIINIILNILLIPKFSYIGSSAATVITELVMIPIFIHILLRTGYAETNAFIKDLPKILLCNVVMAVIIIYIKNFNILLTILIAFLVYVLMIYLTKTLDSEDFMLLKNLFKRNKN
jgi:O-antigen/teichoic acid export membrane protein